MTTTALNAALQHSPLLDFIEERLIIAEEETLAAWGQVKALVAAGRVASEGEMARLNAMVPMTTKEKAEGQKVPTPEAAPITEVGTIGSEEPFVAEPFVQTHE